MEESKIMADVAASVLDKPIKIEIDIIHPTWIDRLKKERKRVFEMSALTLGSLIKISKELLSIGLSFDKGNILDSNYKIIENHAGTMARIVAIAIVNRKSDPGEKLISFLLNNLTAKELSKIAGVVISQMDVLSFMTAIISVKGMNILKMNPEDQGSQIAPGASLEG